MSFARWVKTQRETLRLSQIECALRAGISQSVWSEYENELIERQPRKKTIEQIATGLGLPETEVRAAVIGQMHTPLVSDRRERIAARIGTKPGVDTMSESQFETFLRLMDRSADDLMDAMSAR